MAATPGGRQRSRWDETPAAGAAGGFGATPAFGATPGMGMGATPFGAMGETPAPGMVQMSAEQHHQMKYDREMSERNREQTGGWRG